VAYWCSSASMCAGDMTASGTCTAVVSPARAASSGNGNFLSGSGGLNDLTSTEHTTSWLGTGGGFAMSKHIEG